MSSGASGVQKQVQQVDVTKHVTKHKLASPAQLPSNQGNCEKEASLCGSVTESHIYGSAAKLFTLWSVIFM